MTGARVTPERAASFATSQPYLDETLAVVTEDHQRGIPIVGGDSGDGRGPDRRPEPALLPLHHPRAPARGGAPRRPHHRRSARAGDAIAVYILPAERASVLTMLNPRLPVVVPEGVKVQMPLAYPIADEDPAWMRYVNTWIGIKKRDGFIDRLYDHWILGRSDAVRAPRWSITATCSTGGSTAAARARVHLGGRRRSRGLARLLPANHHLGRLDDRHRLVAAGQLQLGQGVAGDDRGEPLVADPQPDLRQQAVVAHLVDDAAQLVAAAERDEHTERCGRAGRAAPRPRPPAGRAGDRPPPAAPGGGRRRCAPCEPCPCRSTASGRSS